MWNECIGEQYLRNQKPSDGRFAAGKVNDIKSITGEDWIARVREEWGLPTEAYAKQWIMRADDDDE